MSSMDVPADRPVGVPAAKVAVAKPTYITWVTFGERRVKHSQPSHVCP